MIASMMCSHFAHKQKNEVPFVLSIDVWRKQIKDQFCTQNYTSSVNIMSAVQFSSEHHHQHEISIWNRKESMEEKIRKLTYKMALGHYNDVSI
jgi:hypothetical protein